MTDDLLGPAYPITIHTKPISVFEGGMSDAIEVAMQEIRDLYLEDEIPWCIGVSLGKDSTATLQLIWRALEKLPKDKLTKPVHTITTDTLVENPVVSAWVNASLDKIGRCAKEHGLPIIPHKLTPAIEDTFWVNLIGRGYAAPRPLFRWCTNRLKISPSNEFIKNMVSKNGECILVLGTRRAESATRAANMAKHAKRAVREKLTLNATLPNCLVYTPIEHWSTDDVWAYLTREKNPWGQSNHDLMSMYRGATEDGECPLVVDKSTPSCGNSRFGCYVCTLVKKDKSMGAMIQNDVENEWMEPLLELRNMLDFRGDENHKRDRESRDFRRMHGGLTIYRPGDSDEDKLVPGPYTQAARAEWLRRVLTTQQIVDDLAPPEFGEIVLLTLPELEEIRRHWVVEKHEIEDLVPVIYEDVIGKPYPGKSFSDDILFDREVLAMLKEECEMLGETNEGSDKDGVSGFLMYELTRSMLDIQNSYCTRGKRRGILNALERAVERCFYDGPEDALNRAISRKKPDRAIDKTASQDLPMDDMFQCGDIA